jgi:hypothetical protein
MKRLTLRSLVVLVLLVPVGYLSNLVTKRACERRSARDAVAGIEQDGVRVPWVYVLNESPVNSASALTAVGTPVRPCKSKPSEFDCWPWVEIFPAETIRPYVVSVRSGFVAAPLAGRGTLTRYFCLFGIAVKVSEVSLWYT